MNVIFRRTGDRRYAVIIERPEQAPQVLEPAPGYDPNIPHDLVHYVVEVTLGLTTGVFGRAANGGGSFLSAGLGDARARARQQRKQRRREQRLREQDEAGRHEMNISERLAGLSDVAWRRRQGQRPAPTLWKPADELSAEDRARIERVVEQLDRIAPMWRRVPIGGELAFVWPNLEPAN